MVGLSYYPFTLHYSLFPFLVGRGVVGAKSIPFGTPLRAFLILFPCPSSPQKSAARFPGTPGCAPYKTFPLQGGRCSSAHTGADEGGPVKRISPSFYLTPPHPSGLRPSTFPPEGGRFWGAPLLRGARRPRRTKSRLGPLLFAACKDGRDGLKDHFFFPAGKRNGFWNPKKKGLPYGLSGSK